MRTWRVGSIEIFPDTRRVLLNGQPIPIGSRAFDLLFFSGAASRPRRTQGRAVSRGLARHGGGGQQPYGANIGAAQAIWHTSDPHRCEPGIPLCG